MHVGGWLLLQVLSKCGDRDEEQHRTTTQGHRRYLDPADPPTSSPTFDPLLLYRSHCLGLRGWCSAEPASAPEAQGRRGWQQGRPGEENGDPWCCWRAGKLPGPGWDLGACPCLWPGKPCSCPGSFAGDCHSSSLVPLACLEPALITRIKRKAMP